MNATETGLIGTALGAIVAGGPGWVAWRRVRSDVRHTDADTASTIVDMARQQLESYKDDVAALRAEIVQLRAQYAEAEKRHSLELRQIREEMLGLENQLSAVLGENLELRTKVTLLESNQR